MLQALLLGKNRGQLFKPVGFFALGTSDMRTEASQDFRLLQHVENPAQGQRRLIIQPARFQQGRRSPGSIADLRVVELAGAKVLALAHHHPHPQCLRGAGQLSKTCDKTLLVEAQYIVITGGNPVEHMLEIFQVIKRVFEGIGNHWQHEPLALDTGYAYRYQFARYSGKSYWMSGLQAHGPSGRLTGMP